MAKKQNVGSILSKQFGKDVADALLNKVDRMVKQGATAEKIEEAFLKALNAQVEKRIGSLVGTSVQSLRGVRALTAVQSKRLVAVQSKK